MQTTSHAALSIVSFEVWSSQASFKDFLVAQLLPPPPLPVHPPPFRPPPSPPSPRPHSPFASLQSPPSPFLLPPAHHFVTQELPLSAAQLLSPPPLPPPKPPPHPPFPLLLLHSVLRCCPVRAGSRASGGAFTARANSKHTSSCSIIPKVRKQ